ncbi:MAG: hypothetical protein ACREWG_06645 [Gammaproteobacteria bacterium]
MPIIAAARAGGVATAQPGNPPAITRAIMIGMHRHTRGQQESLHHALS